MKINLSKSQYTRALKCPLSIWYYKNDKSIPRKSDESSIAIMEEGTKIGILAQKLYPNGVEISLEDFDIKKAKNDTEKAIKEGNNAIYEALAINSDGNYAFIDILLKVGENEWDLIEVKSSSKVHDYYLDDIAFQRYVFTSSGYNIRKSILLHLNKDYVRKGKLELDKLFIKKDLTDIAKEKEDEVKQRINSINNIIKNKEKPNIKVGSQCNKSYLCDYKDYCWKDIPKYSIYNLLSRSHEKRDELLEQDIIEVCDVPDSMQLSENKTVEVIAHKTNTTTISKENIKDFLKEIKYPIYFLDYETIAPAIPLFDNSRPYQKIPFQFSCHVLEKENGEIKHFEFLHQDKTDPRPDFIKALIKACGNNGTILVYNQSFEKNRNKELARDFPEYADEINNIKERMYDLMLPFQKRYYYNPKQEGSHSIKKVLPCFDPKLSYKELEIQEGGTASNTYFKIITDNFDGNKEEVFKNLLEYCCLDTLSMVKLLEGLKIIV
jgi:CRISPR/Cas system-associated exonuclease Cas4 (RecB family)